MDIGEKIKRLRVERGWTQQDLGDRIGVQKAAINKYEIGSVVNLKQKTIRALSEVFGVAAAWLMDDSDWPPAYLDSAEDTDLARLEALHKDPRLGLLFDRSRKMSHDDVEFMIQMADRILKERDGE